MKRSKPLSRSIAPLLIILALLLQACQPMVTPPADTGETTDAADNVELVTTFGQEVWGEGNLENLEDYVSADYVGHVPGEPEPQDIEGLRNSVTSNHAGLSDTEMTIVDAFGEGDLVLVHWALSGTHSGSIMGEPPTDNEVVLQGMSIVRVADGKIVEQWEQSDVVGLLTQLGVMPPQGPPPMAEVPEPAPPVAGDVSADQVEAQKEIARRVSLEMWGEGNTELAEEFYAPDVVYHNNPSGEPVGLESLIGEVQMVNNGVSEMETQVHQVIGAGDRVAVRWEVNGVHSGNMFGIPASGNNVRVTGIASYRFADGQIVEEWSNQDIMGMMYQLGAVPPSGVVFAGTEDDIPISTYTATNYNFEGPTTLTSGWNRLQMVNEGGELHHAQLIRLEDGHTLDELMGVMMESGGILPEWASWAGGPSVAVPGEAVSAVVNLEPGNYVLICVIPDSEGVPHVAHGMALPIEVTEGEGEPVAAPAADITMELFDYNYTLSDTVTQGTKTFRVVNNGPQPHEVAIVWLAPGASVEDFVAAVESGEGPPPGKPIGGMQVIGEGDEAYFTAQFSPGRYALLCFHPDEEDGAPHLAHGMVQVITVR